MYFHVFAMFASRFLCDRVFAGIGEGRAVGSGLAGSGSSSQCSPSSQLAGVSV